MKRIIKCASLNDMIDAFKDRIDELEGDRYLTSATYIDTDGGFGEVGAKYTFEEIRDYWDKEHDNDPVLNEYKSFDEWWNDTKQSMQEDIDGSSEICGVYDIDEINLEEVVDWLYEQGTAAEDAKDAFGTDDLMDVSLTDLERWICNQDELCYDYCDRFDLNPDSDEEELN